MFGVFPFGLGAIQPDLTLAGIHVVQHHVFDPLAAFAFEAVTAGIPVPVVGAEAEKVETEVAALLPGFLTAERSQSAFGDRDRLGIGALFRGRRRETAEQRCCQGDQTDFRNELAGS